MTINIDLNDEMSTPLGKLKHPEIDGLFAVFYKPNLEAGGPEYFLISMYNENKSRICRICVDKPEYITGYDENCKLTKVEKDLLMKILTTDTTDWGRIMPNIVGLDPNEKLEGFTGWETYLNEHNTIKKWDYVEKEDQFIPDEITMPDYNLLEEED